MRKKVTISEQLWFFQFEKTTRLVYTPFVLALGSGVLEPEVFDSFMELEKVVLHEFAKLYDIAKEHLSDTVVKDAFHHFKTSALSQHSDLKHDLQHVEGGSSGVASKFIGFLGEIGRKGKPHHILAAILPVMRTYKYIGEYLSRYDSSKSPFFKWISTYSSEEFDMSVKNMEHILNKLVVRPGKRQVRNLFRISIRSKRLLAEILHALTQPTITPLIKNYPDMVMFVGFDVNATADVDHAGEDKGWCSSLFDFQSTSALLSKGETQENDEYEHTINVLRSASEFLSQKHEPCIRKITPVLSTAYSFSSLEEEFKHLTKCEWEANKELIKSSMLKGLEEKYIKQFGKQFSFPSPVCFELFSKFSNRANVVSSSLCGANIVKEVLDKDVDDLHIKLALKQVSVYGNELCFEQSSCTGEFQIEVQTAKDKLCILQDKIERQCCLTIYVGEALNDLLALMKANIGIVVNPNSRLLSVAPQFGIECVPLYSGLLNKSKLVKSSKQEEGVQSIWTEDSGVLYTVTNWEQLYLFLCGEPEEPKKLQFQEKDEFANTTEDDYLKKSGVDAYMKALKARLEDERDIFSVDDREDYLSDDEIPFVNHPDSDFEDDFEDEDSS